MPLGKAFVAPATTFAARGVRGVLHSASDCVDYGLGRAYYAAGMSVSDDCNIQGSSESQLSRL